MKKVRMIMILVLIGFLVFLVVTGTSRTKSLKAVASPVCKQISQERLEEKTQADLKSDYGLRRDEVDGFVLYGPISAHGVEEVLIVRAKDSDQMGKIRRAVEARNREKRETVGAGSEEEKLLKGSIVCIRGRYLLYAAAENAGSLKDTFCEAVR